MNKKAYIQPSTIVVLMNYSQHILTGSTDLSGFSGDGNIGLPSDGGSGEGIVVNSRRGGLWDDED